MKDIQDYEIIIFDADGTLRRCTVEGQPCPNKPGEWELIPGVVEKLRQLNPKKYYFIISNQGGVAFGLMFLRDAQSLMEDLKKALIEATGLRHWHWYMCPHHPKGTMDEYRLDCPYRKPRPKMINVILKNWGFWPHDALMIGDMESDKAAAEAAEVDFMWAKDFFGWENE